MIVLAVICYAHLLFKISIKAEILEISYFQLYCYIELRLTWVVMHSIDENSYLFSVDEDSFLTGEYQLFISLTGLDATLSQTIYARHIYYTSDIKWNHRFVDVIQTEPNGHRHIEYEKFHDTIPI